MSSQTVTKKRKSPDGAEKKAKKVKIAKAAEAPMPLKSALKKPAIEAKEVQITTPASNKSTKANVKKTNVPNGKPVKHNKEAIVEEVEDDNEEEFTTDQTAQLLAGFSSSEDEADSDTESGLALSSLPKPPTTIQKQILAATTTADPETTPGVLYISRIPHGFFEPQMRAYFSQFGAIDHLRLARNRKTGASRHYAFLQFASAAVADIVARTMDKYLLFGHLLQVRVVPAEQIRGEWWRGAEGRARKKPAPRNRLEGGKYRRGATREVWEERVRQEKERREGKAKKLVELGYEFEMPAVRDVGVVPTQIKEVEGEVGVVEDEEAVPVEVVEETKMVENGVDGDVEVSETQITKKRSATGKPATKKVVKKVKA